MRSVRPNKSEGRASARSKPAKAPKQGGDARKHVPPKSGILPFVAVTFAMTADGKATTKNFTGVDFTSREDKAHLIRQRARGDAVLIGYGTLKHDNVRLGIAREELRQKRIARGQAPYPLRVIVSNSGRIDPTLNIFQTDFAPIIIFSTTRMPRTIQQLLGNKATLHLSKTSRVNLKRMLQRLHHDHGVKYVACEGGPELFRSLVERGLVDQLNLTIAPFVFGGRKALTLTGVDFEFLRRTIRCSLKEMQVLGEECFITYALSSRARSRDPVVTPLG